MNIVLDAIKSRRSIRKFKSDMVEQDKIDQIVQAGLYAASGMNKQATKIIVAPTGTEKNVERNKPTIQAVIANITDNKYIFGRL